MDLNGAAFAQSESPRPASFEMAHLVQDRDRTRASSRPTIILVEAPGSPPSRVRQIAAEGGFRVLSASSGPMLQSYARRSAPDLILLGPDTGPPGPSEIARSIKKDAATRNIPVLQITRSARNDDEDRYSYPTEALVSDDAPADEILRTLRVLTNGHRRVRPLPETPPDPTIRSRAPLEGDLESDTFPEVLQFLFAASKTGRITLRDGIEIGMICIESGKVVHAEIGDLEGLAAFRRMCFAQQGWFRFEPGAPAPKRTMRGDGIALLLESARQKDVGEPPPVIRFPVKRKSASFRRDLSFLAPEEPESPISRLAPAGIALLAGALLLLAWGLLP
jgi:CheY-like chemotaxis protein